MIDKIIKGIQNPRKILLYLSRPLEAAGCFDKISDEKWIPIRYWLRMGSLPDLKNPKTYNEKLQWLKLYNRNPLYTRLVDKYEVKEFVSDCVGEQYVIPSLGVWEKFDDINFDILPEKFVLKTTHDSGGVVICKDKKNFNMDRANQILTKSLKNNYYLRKGREWPYKDVKPRIMAEKYMEDSKTGELRDYKFFTFWGGGTCIICCIEPPECK